MALHRCKRVVLLTSAALCLETGIAAAQIMERPYHLELRIECPQQNTLLGDEIPIVFTITSRDTQPFIYDDRNYDRSGRIPEYALVAGFHDGTRVPDPRERGLPVIGGGLTGRGTLWPGGSFQKSVVLNLWALITEPGRYSVAGVYHYSVQDNDKKPLEGYARTRGVRVTSPPIEIQVKPRSRRQMGRYIAELTGQLASLEGNNGKEARRERTQLAARLAYTCDKQIIPTMLDLLYTGGNEGFEAFQAFWCYLPHADDVRATVLDAARTRGLGPGMGLILEHLGCTEGELAETIRLSLASKDPNIVSEGISTAQKHPSDAYIPRLIAIAVGNDAGSLGGREGAISAVACHRTDQGVAALRILLNDPDEHIRKTTADAIRHAYRRHPVYPEQVDEAYTAALVSVATDPRHLQRYGAVNEIARTRTREGVNAVKILLADSNAEVPAAATDLGVRTIRDLLRDSDPKVREHTRVSIETAYHEYAGRPLRPDDFPPEFHEDLEARKKRILEKWLKVE